MSGMTKQEIKKKWDACEEQLRQVQLANADTFELLHNQISFLEDRIGEYQNLNSELRDEIASIKMAIGEWFLKFIRKE